MNLSLLRQNYKELRAYELSEKLVQIICITSHIYELVSVTIKFFGFSTEFGQMTNFGNLPLNFVFVFFHKFQGKYIENNILKNCQCQFIICLIVIKNMNCEMAELDI